MSPDRVQEQSNPRFPAEVQIRGDPNTPVARQASGRPDEEGNAEDENRQTLLGGGPKLPYIQQQLQCQQSLSTEEV